MTSVASRPAPPPIPSHSQFLRAQIRSSLAHLHATNELDEGSLRKIESILSGNNVDVTTVDEKKSDDELSQAAKKLANDKDWLRHVLLETNLIPNTVSMAMSVAVPSAIIGSAQRAAIVELVTLSQKKIANAITDPKWQVSAKDATFAGAKGAHAGIKKGFNAAGQSLGGVARKRENMLKKSELKKREKREEKEIKKELKREREEIIQKRQEAFLSGNGDAMSRTVSKEDGSRRASIAGSTSTSGDPKKMTSGGNEGTFRSSLTRDTSTYAQSEEIVQATDMNGEAMVSVSCSEILSQGSVAATTTFSPWPGLLLTSTIVATNDEEDDDDDYDESMEQEGREKQDLSEVNMQKLNDTAAATPPPPPRRAPPSSSMNHGDVDLASPMQSAAPPMRTFPQQDTNEVVDVTESKQKSWTKKLGL